MVFMVSGSSRMLGSCPGRSRIQNLTGKRFPWIERLTEGICVAVGLSLTKSLHVVDYSYRGPVIGIGDHQGAIVPILGTTVPGKSLVDTTARQRRLRVMSYIEIGAGLRDVPLNFGFFGAD